MFASATMVAFQLAGRATRDALYLSSFELSTLPRIVVASSAIAALVCLVAARFMARVGPGRLVPALFLASAALLGLEWGLAFVARPAAAIVFYLHFGALGALLISGFWALVNERFDPRTARRVVARVTLGATVGGLVGGLLPERVGALTTMFPLLAGLHALAGVLVFSLRGPAAHAEAEASVSPLRTLRASPYLQGLVLLVVLTAMAEGLLDFVFKLRATQAAPGGVELLRLFARFYTVAALLSLAVQAFLLRPVLVRIGIARSAALLPAGVAAGALGGLLAPGLAPMLVARGTEIVLRSSVFKGAYEMLFTPLAAAEKRATKLLVDVGASRLGDALGGAALQAVLALGAASSWLLGGVVLLSAAAALVARGLHRGYVATLERGLARGMPELAADGPTLLRTFEGFDITQLRAVAPARAAAPVVAPPAVTVPVVDDPDAARAVLARGLTTSEDVERAIGLLAWDAVAPAALDALRAAPPEATAAMVAHLLDPAEDFAIRRRLVPALAERPTDAAFAGLLAALGDRRFEVRYRASRALGHVVRVEPRHQVDAARIHARVLEEVSVEKGVWEGRQLLDEADESWAAEDAELLRLRAGRSMEHVFALLALVLPREPLRLAYRGLLVDDPHLRGTALEYLESVLPERVRERLWPYLEPAGRRAAKGAAGDALARLLASSDAIREASLTRVPEHGTDRS